MIGAITAIAKDLFHLDVELHLVEEEVVVEEEEDGVRSELPYHYLFLIEEVEGMGRGRNLGSEWRGGREEGGREWKGEGGREEGGRREEGRGKREEGGSS